MKTRSALIVTLVSLAISGCGGGSSGSSIANGPPSQDAPVSSAPATGNPANPLPQPSESIENVTATKDLTAKPDFNLASNLGVAVDINLAGLNNDSGYLSICAPLDGGRPDYDNCFLRSTLPDATYKGTLRLSSAIKVAYSAVWFRDLSRPGIITRHDLNSGNIKLHM